MTLKEKLKSFAMDNHIEKYAEHNAKQLEQIADEYAIEFYNFMQDNYCQVSDGFVKDLSVDESKRIIITTEKALEIFKKEKGL